MNGIKVYYYAPSYADFSIIEYIDRSLHFPQMLNITINVYFTLSYYAAIMLNTFNDPLC